MTYENQLRLARIASSDTWNGTAHAKVLADRMKSLFGEVAGQEIVSRVYTHPRGVASYNCGECGRE